MNPPNEAREIGAVLRRWEALGQTQSASMSQLFRLPNSARRDPCIDTWLRQHTGELGEIAKHWFEAMRRCGDDLRECLHDGHPTACVTDAAFGYVNALKAHVNVGFFRGAEITDPKGILESTGKIMEKQPLCGNSLAAKRRKRMQKWNSQLTDSLIQSSPIFGFPETWSHHGQISTIDNLPR
jgi:hypothetical protein